MLKTSSAIISMLHRNIWIGPIGYLASFAFEVTALLLAAKIVTTLPNLQSFSDIAFPSYVGLTCGVLGAAMAIITLRTDSDEFSED